jgi:hypothetical protein
MKMLVAQIERELETETAMIGHCDVTVKPQNGNSVRVTFPLRYELRNGRKQSSGKIAKTIVLEPTGDDLQIVAVNERKAR